MPNYVAVSKELHKNMFWKPVSNFSFAAQDALCPIVIQEAPRAALHLPIAFSKMGDHFGLFVVQGFEPGSNYLVDATGNWLAGYIPAAYRGFPFALTNAEDQQVLCFDSDSGLINDKEGNTFFDETGEPSAQIKQTLDFLSQVSQNHSVTVALCLLLEKLDLLEPWPISVKKDDEDVSVDGLFCIDEGKFNSLKVEDLVTLRDRGVLALIYCQLLSMQNLARINPGSKPGELPLELPFDLPNDDGNISFEGL